MQETFENQYLFPKNKVRGPLLCLFGFRLISPKSYSAAGPHLGYFQHCWQGFWRGFHGSVLILRSSGLSDAATSQRGLVTIPRQPPPPMGHQGGELVKALSRGKLFPRFGEPSALSESQSQWKRFPRCHRREEKADTAARCQPEHAAALLGRWTRYSVRLRITSASNTAIFSPGESR